MFRVTELYWRHEERRDGDERRDQAPGRSRREDRTGDGRSPPEAPPDQVPEHRRGAGAPEDHPEVHPEPRAALTEDTEMAESSAPPEPRGRSKGGEDDQFTEKF